MFRTRPPAFALACVALWGAQMAIGLVVFIAPGRAAPEGTRLWQASGLACGMGLGTLLLVQLPRALQWQRRRSRRPSGDVLQERRRIARDLHDKVGSQLVSAMALLDAREPLHRPALQALEHCMLDVRLLVDSMDGGDDSLGDSLARLRHRIQPVLDHRGIGLAWNVQTAPESAMPIGCCARELACVAQEAISNALQHADATALSVELRHATGPAGRGEWHLRICDNGKGLPAGGGGAQAGHGMAGMRRRVQAAGGVLEVAPVETGGVSIHIVVPARA